MFLSFIRFELLSFEHGNPNITQNMKYNSVALLLRYESSFLYTRGTRFPSHLFPHILSISLKSDLFSWERLDSSIFVCTS